MNGKSRANSAGTSSSHTQLSGEAGSAAPNAAAPAPTVNPGHFENDFIIIAEFSEHEGPVPLMVFPEGNEGSFDVNRFVVRLMSVDYQRGHDPSRIPEDTQVVIVEPEEDAHVYVHHFTLYDIFARGYVRPVCMAFVTRDPRKVMSQFENLLAQFSRVSSVFKTGNQFVFLRDLEHRVADLQLTKRFVFARAQLRGEPVDADSLAKEKLRTESDDGDDEGEMSSSIKHMSVARAQLVTPGETVPATDEAAQAAVIAAALTEEFGLETLPRLANYMTPAHVAYHLADMENMHSRLRVSIYDKVRADNTLSAMFAFLDDATPRATVDTAAAAAAAAVPTVTTSTADSATAAAGGEGAAAGAGAVALAATIAGAGGAAAAAPSDRVAADVQQFIMAKDYRPVILEVLHKSQDFNKKLRSLPELCLLGYADGLARLKKLYRHFSRSCLDLIIEASELDAQGPASSLLSIGNMPVVNFCMDVSSYDNCEHSLLPMARMPTPSRRPRGASVSGVPIDRARSASPSQSSLVAESIVSTSPPTSFEDARSTLDATFDAEMEDNEDEYENRSDHEVDARPLRHPWDFSLGPRLWRKAPPNSGLLAFRDKYVWAPHVVYSLLRCRPVVVYGLPSNKRHVKHLVATMSMFVPGARAVVQLWRRKTLQMADLAEVRLVGLSKQTVIPKAVERYISIIDYETEELVSPPYNPGHLIEDLLTRNKRWPDEATFVAHIEHVLLDAGIKAALFYYLCCVGVMPCCLTPEQQARALAAANAGVGAGAGAGAAAGAGAGAGATTPPASGTPEDGSESPAVSHVSGPMSPGSAAAQLENSDSFSTTSSVRGAPSVASAPAGSGKRKGKGNLFSILKLSSPFSGAQRSPASARRETQYTQSTSAPGRERSAAIFKQLRIENSDIDVIQALAEVVKEQQAAEAQAMLAEAQGASDRAEEPEPPAPIICFDQRDSSACRSFRNSQLRK